MRNLNLQDRVRITHTNVVTNSLTVGTEGTVVGIDYSSDQPYWILLDSGRPFYVDLEGNCIGSGILFTVEPINP